MKLTFGTALAVAFLAFLALFMFCFAVVGVARCEPIVAIAIAVAVGPFVGKVLAFTFFTRQAVPA